jgi:hypothetical protein
MRELFVMRLLDRYHPELHYMRGPGPKWLEKHTVFSRPAPIQDVIAKLMRNIVLRLHLRQRTGWHIGRPIPRE